MRNRTRTTFLALAVLDEAIERARSTPLKLPEPGVRLALAYLWSTTAKTNREPYDRLWRLLLDLSAPVAGARLCACGTAFAIICRDVGVQQDAELGAALAKARGARPLDQR